MSIGVWGLALEDLITNNCGTKKNHKINIPRAPISSFINYLIMNTRMLLLTNDSSSWMMKRIFVHAKMAVTSSKSWGVTLMLGLETHSVMRSSDKQSRDQVPQG